eukprot:4352657-Pyramimonas_sp.AAC.1
MHVININVIHIVCTRVYYERRQHTYTTKRAVLKTDSAAEPRYGTVYRVLTHHARRHAAIYDTLYSLCGCVSAIRTSRSHAVYNRTLRPSTYRSCICAIVNRIVDSSQRRLNLANNKHQGESVVELQHIGAPVLVSSKVVIQLQHQVRTCHQPLDHSNCLTTITDTTIQQLHALQHSRAWNNNNCIMQRGDDAPAESTCSQKDSEVNNTSDENSAQYNPTPSVMCPSTSMLHSLAGIELTSDGYFQTVRSKADAESNSPSPSSPTCTTNNDSRLAALTKAEQMYFELDIMWRLKQMELDW